MNKDFDMNKIEIVEFNPVECSKEDWQLYHNYRRIRHEETSPDDPLTPDEIVEKGLQMQMDHPEMVPSLYSINDTSINKRIGTVAFIVFRETSPSYEGNKHLMQYDIALLPEYRAQLRSEKLSKLAKTGENAEERLSEKRKKSKYVGMNRNSSTSERRVP
ncbi:MAG: hypothetical protein H7641_04525 [Candidatus Heimdallarchaeota archaeon]|nr:hypothetical protein [Candidatus Heimdallarchaeota archaeon]MCK4876826.1 hypothetical protein [Candidatus Heimdallarchaeota archaeon]